MVDSEEVDIAASAVDFDFDFAGTRLPVASVEWLDVVRFVVQAVVVHSVAAESEVADTSDWVPAVVGLVAVTPP